MSTSEQPPSKISCIAMALCLAGTAGASGYLVHGWLSVSAAAEPAAGETGTAPISPAQADQRTAPITLYPDALLAQALMASKHPDDVQAAAAWSKAHPEVKGQAAISAVASMPWDASVKSLVAFPQALQTLATDPAWTRKSGAEFAAEPASAMSLQPTEQ